MILLCSRFKKVVLTLPALLIFLLLSACGSSSSDDPVVIVDESVVVLTGSFIDSPVKNLNYRTSSQQGATNENGEFRYIEGESIIFSIGGYDFKSTTATSILTPLDIAGTSNISDLSAINLARLLQSLDSDGAPENGITISDETHGAAQNFTIDLTSSDFDTLTSELLVSSGLGVAALVDSVTASSHLIDSLVSRGIIEAPTPLKGVFIDSPVANLNFRTISQAGATNSSGEFTYFEGEVIIFSLGTIDFPSIQAKAVITPLDFFDTEDINETSVVNMARLLQTLDVDGNPDVDGIKISAAVHASTQEMALDFSRSDFDSTIANLVANSGSVNTTLVSASEAISHLQTTLDNLFPVTNADANWNEFNWDFANWQ